MLEMREIPNVSIDLLDISKADRTNIIQRFQAANLLDSADKQSNHRLQIIGDR